MLANSHNFAMSRLPSPAAFLHCGCSVETSQRQTRKDPQAPIYGSCGTGGAPSRIHQSCLGTKCARCDNCKKLSKMSHFSAQSSPLDELILFSSAFPSSSDLRLRNMSGVRSAAHWSSSADCLPMVQKRHHHICQVGEHSPELWHVSAKCPTLPFDVVSISVQTLGGQIFDSFVCASSSGWVRPDSQRTSPTIRDVAVSRAVQPATRPPNEVAHASGRWHQPQRGRVRMPP